MLHDKSIPIKVNKIFSIYNLKTQNFNFLTTHFTIHPTSNILYFLSFHLNILFFFIYLFFNYISFSLPLCHSQPSKLDLLNAANPYPPHPPTSKKNTNHPYPPIYPTNSHSSISTQQTYIHTSHHH